MRKTIIAVAVTMVSSSALFAASNITPADEDIKGWAQPNELAWEWTKMDVNHDNLISPSEMLNYEKARALAHNRSSKAK